MKLSISDVLNKHYEAVIFICSLNHVQAALHGVSVCCLNFSFAAYLLS